MTKIVRFSRLSQSGSDALATESIDASLRGGVVSIGNFDGVHVGHRALLTETKKQATELGVPSIAVIFDPHPAAILRPDFVPEQLTWIQRRAELMNDLGIDFLLVVETTRDFLNLSAQAFFDALIVFQLAAKAVVEGPNFFFGHKRQGNVQTLADLCDQHQIRFTIAQPAQSGDDLISSTRIRQLLVEGDLQQATDFLGAPYRIRGKVIAGEKRGRTIGFPTANLGEIDVVIPAPGVYGGWASTGTDIKCAAIHIGPNPTFDEANHKVEVHLLDFADDLYNRTLTVDFVTFVRGIARFDSADQLAAQLRHDVTTIRNLLNHSRTANGDATDSDNTGN